ncbi:MAG: peptidylprolyl isomerase [Acidimicrobiia bacterium]|nr:peptidylprolyl isomerase [Acidimicrobiia bacterium]
MKRTAQAIAGGLAAVALTGCGTFSGNDAAAIVDGREIGQDEFQRLLEVFAENTEVTGLAVDGETATVSADQVRGVLGLLVQNAASTDFLAARGEAITGADRADLVEQFAGNPALEALPDDVIDFVIDVQVAPAARARLTAPPIEELEADYVEEPGRLGLLCLRQVVVATEDEAEAARDEIAAGAELADVAADRSIDPDGAQNGGVLFGPDGQPCVPLSLVTQQFGPAYTDAVLDVGAGGLTDPVQSASGWHVALVRPYDEIADSVNAQYTVSAGELMWLGHLATADIDVDPRYGRWDPAAAAVVALR